ncbi:MAG: GNAT family N-acetyltransferase [Candidatus Hodarchaeota archaeon]
MLEVEVIKNESDFFNLRNSWSKLLKETRLNSIFVTWEWLFIWWKHYGYNKKLKIIIIKEDNKIIGIAPFVLSKNKFLGLITYSKIEFMGLGEAYSEHLHFIIKPGKETLVLNSIIYYFKQNSYKWDIIRLYLDEQSNNINKIINLFKLNYYKVVSNISNVCPYIELPECWKLYYSSLSRNMKEHVRRKSNLLNRKFKIKFTIINDHNLVDKALNILIYLHQKRQKEKGKIGSFSSKQFINFHKDIFSVFISNSWLKFYLLEINNKPVACLYGYRYNHIFYYYQSGFDTNWAKYSVGTVLMAFCINDAISNKLKIFDLLTGSEIYKYKWTKKDIKVWDIYIYRPSLKNFLFIYIRNFKERKIIKLIKSYILNRSLRNIH